MAVKTLAYCFVIAQIRRHVCVLDICKQLTSSVIVKLIPYTTDLPLMDNYVNSV